MAIALAATKDNLEFGRYLIDGERFELGTVNVIDGKDATKQQTIWLVINDGNVTTIGLQNYLFAFTSPEMHIAFRNNLLWLIVGTGGSVVLGLLIATFVDRIKREALAKSFIFLPLAISSVGASVIWKFVYAWQPPGREQVGLLNAIVTSFEIEPIPWIIETPLNTFALIVIMIWLQTGFAMVVLSAALKGIPNEIIEASRIDGASEFQLFFRIILPMIRGSIITVGTTIFIAILKVFDIVFVMTSGRFDTEVIANRMFIEMFTFRNFGRASALAFILLVVVIPIMVLNIQNLRRQGINR
ncbi:MAG: sugar ABC transporter permease [Chloroflexi bacterium]|nr:MAG: sugar ABC transporter permease [Chloroflexota bacterium]MBL1196725.1 sugar ABC transporter permease [Chloroflexota bacterium]NOH14018.1 sugar ABC transporter permease [Chloroflexota bacterium]